MDMLSALFLARECFPTVRAIVARLPGVPRVIGMLATGSPSFDFLLALEAPHSDDHYEG